jgi:hypothetical protein
MKQLIFTFFILFSLFGCNQGKKIPNVSSIKIDLVTERFETSFFKLDTFQLDASLNQLNQQYPGFAKDFLFNILGTTPAAVYKDVPAFIHSYQTIYSSTRSNNAQFNASVADIKKGFQYVHYYFPQYILPKKCISFIGPINSFGTIITTDAIAIGLQLFLGKNHPLYTSEQGQSMYPAFISRRFEPDYIPVNAMKSIIDDMYPNKSIGKPLIEQMVESGKRLYLLDLFLPHIADTLKTGYTQIQLDACFKSEQNIWSMFIQNELLFQSDPQFTRDYINDGPTTQTLGEGSPGNIGQFVGWQIVKKWMNKNKLATLKDLMEKDPGKLFAESKYKPT